MTYQLIAKVTLLAVFASGSALSAVSQSPVPGHTPTERDLYGYSEFQWQAQAWRSSVSVSQVAETQVAETKPSPKQYKYNWTFASGDIAPQIDAMAKKLGFRSAVWQLGAFAFYAEESIGASSPELLLEAVLRRTGLSGNVKIYSNRIVSYEYEASNE